MLRADGPFLCAGRIVARRHRALLATRVSWLEPEDAAARVRDGLPFVVEWCDAPPQRGRIERFKRDVLARMITKAEAARYANKSVVPTVVVGELWSGSAGDCLLFVEQGPP